MRHLAVLADLLRVTKMAQLGTPYCGGIAGTKFVPVGL